MSTPEFFNNPVKWGKLWLHESERVYADRLVSTTDLENFNKAAVSIAKKWVASLTWLLTAGVAIVGVNDNKAAVSIVKMRVVCMTCSVALMLQCCQGWRA
eukprot:1157319-Pelagomonas_calceolata.AAC.7